MRATGIVRSIDDLGRIAIPRELRSTHNLGKGDSVEIFIDDNGDIILRKYQPGCIICGGMEGVQTIRGKHLCSKCIETVKRLKVGV